MKPYKLLESASTGMEIIELTEAPYGGFRFSFGRVEFVPDEEEEYCTLKFDYDIIDDNGIDYDQSELETYIGKLLEGMIMEGLTHNNIVYTGGTD